MSDYKPLDSRRPYLIRALYQWILDQGGTPYVTVAANHPDVVVPTSFVRDGTITLNLHPRALGALNLDTNPVWISARFGGRPFECLLPTDSILAVFWAENGEGMPFDLLLPPDPLLAETLQPHDRHDHPPVSADDPEPPQPPRPPLGKPSLRIVK